MADRRENKEKSKVTRTLRYVHKKILGTKEPSPFSIIDTKKLTDKRNKLLKESLDY